MPVPYDSALIDALDKEMKTCSNARAMRRLTSLRTLINSGETIGAVALNCGICHKSLSRWYKILTEQGVCGLYDAPRSGRPNYLNDEQIQIIDESLQQDPSNFGYYVWEGKTLSDFIKRQFNIDYSVRACQRLINELGFSRVRPQKRPPSAFQDEEARECFKKSSRNIEQG